MNQNCSAACLDPALLADLEQSIEWAKRVNAAHKIADAASLRLTVDADEELLVCEYLRDLGADLEGDSESDGPDTIRATGSGWVLVLKVQ